MEKKENLKQVLEGVAEKYATLIEKQIDNTEELMETKRRSI